MKRLYLFFPLLAVVFYMIRLGERGYDRFYRKLEMRKP
jgi:hypothetical protein